MRVLQACAEIFPLLKTGGLADVAGALPPALQALGCDTRVVLPGFPAIVRALADPVDIGDMGLPWGARQRVWRGTLRLAGPQGPALTAYVVIAPELFDRPGNPYEDAERRPYGDNLRRFAAFGWAAAALARAMDRDWAPHLLHGHDWHAGLAPALLAHWGEPHVPTVFTVHNLAYQGLFPAEQFTDLGLPDAAFQISGVEFFGQVSFMKAALFYADRITTVSPTYAREIQGDEQGCGLQGLLRGRSANLSGILNGVDEAIWNPASDTETAAPYDAERPQGKAACKAALQTLLGLAPRPDAPVFAVVSRLTEQKGLPLVLGGLQALVERGAQLAVLGSGDAGLEAAFVDWAARHPQQVAVRIGYDEALAHRLFAGSDFTIVPSMFEPCGLTQLYGLKYGSVPLVRRVGGLADTVADTSAQTLADGTATGIVFERLDMADYLAALHRAIDLFHDRHAFDEVRRHGMQQHFGWARAAHQYLELFEQLVPS